MFFVCICNALKRSNIKANAFSIRKLIWIARWSKCIKTLLYVIWMTLLWCSNSNKLYVNHRRQPFRELKDTPKKKHILIAIVLVYLQKSLISAFCLPFFFFSSSISILNKLLSESRRAKERGDISISFLSPVLDLSQPRSWPQYFFCATVDNACIVDTTNLFFSKKKMMKK